MNWSKDINQTLAAAKEQSRPILLDFSAAPAGGACARLDAESYQDRKTAEFIRQDFLPVKAHIEEHSAWFHRFDAVGTPIVLLLDAAGKERVRLEGYPPNNDFIVALKKRPWLHRFVQKKHFANRQ